MRYLSLVVRYLSLVVPYLSLIVPYLSLIVATWRATGKDFLNDRVYRQHPFIFIRGNSAEEKRKSKEERENKDEKGIGRVSGEPREQ